MSSINWLKKLQGYKQQVKKEQLDFLKKGVPRDSLWSGWFLQEYYYLIH